MYVIRKIGRYLSLMDYSYLIGAIVSVVMTLIAVNTTIDQD